MENPVLIFLLLFFFAAVAVGSFKTIHLPGRGFMLFRVLIPSWRFFEDIGEVPALYYRLNIGSADFGPWESALSKPERAWHSIFVNANGSLYLALNSLLNQLQHDIEELDETRKDEFIQSVSYQLLQNLVETQVVARHPDAKSFKFQFKVSLLADTGAVTDVLISPIHEH